MFKLYKPIKSDKELLFLKVYLLYLSIDFFVFDKHWPYPKKTFMAIQSNAYKRLAFIFQFFLNTIREKCSACCASK